MSFRRETISIRSKVFATYLLVIGMGLTIPAGSFLKSVLLRTVHADTTPQTLPFSQNWSNTGLITTDDNWSGVPGIIGYRGDDATAGTGVDPQTVTQDLSAVVDVNANRNDPNTFTTGGVTEFDGIADPVVALQGSGTADFPNLVISLNTTGQTNIGVSYNLRDIDGSADNAVQPVALQYRVGASGNYTNIPAGFVADATTGPNLATLVTPASVTLPAACENQPIVQLRIITSNAAGSDEWVGVDDINVNMVSGTPTLNINDVALAEGNGGTTNFNFTVSLTAPAGAGGVTFSVNTADNTATTADNDYVVIVNGSGSILQGNSSTMVTVQVNGDTTPEPNETFFVNISNISGATPGDTQGLGSINNDDFTLTPIHDIQGSGTTSPLVNQVVTTTGIVTGLKSNGFFLQTPDANVDADPNTSEGIFVFTSSAPPAAAAIGNSVSVTGTVVEFMPTSDPSSPPTTEIGSSPTVSLQSSGNPLPTPITLTSTDTGTGGLNSGSISNLEKYEGMRVRVNSLTVGAPTGGNIDEVNATSTSFGDFYGVITGVSRPFRESGIEVPYPTPTPYPSGPAPPNAPSFDANPERVRINSLGVTGSSDLQVSTNAVVTNITGPLDYGFRTYTIDTDPPAVSPTPTVTGGMTAVPVPTPIGRELTIASFNMQRFFDTTDDPSTSDVVLTSTAFNNRLNKASLAIRNILRSPDVIGVEEMEGGPAGSDNNILQLVANKVNADEGTPNDYQAYLARGNDVGGINVGFLVRSSRITVFSATQYNKTETFTDPSTGSSATLNDRPPVVLRASIVQPSGATLSFSVVVNHLRSLSSITLLTNAGAHTRVKRQKQAESLARLINSMQNGGPEQVLPYDQNIVSVGDYNAFQFNDGYVDGIGTIKGTPAPANQVVESSPDLNNPDLTDVIDFVPADQKYSYTFGGNAQAIDHILVNQTFMARFSRLAYGRMDADFQDSFRNDPNRPERLSDHDPEVAYFMMAVVPTAENGKISGRISDGNGAPVSGAAVNLSGTQNRRAITNADGKYRFDEVETNGFYTVTPSRANYSFTPASRSFSQLGNNTDAAFTGSFTGDAANPLDTTEYFVRQQYLDFLGREPDEGGLAYWSAQINQCGDDAACVSQKRIDVSAAFFASAEFQQTGSYIYGLYAGTLGRAPNFGEFMPDRAQVVGGSGLDQAKTAFSRTFVQRSEFIARYPVSMTREQFVDAVILAMQVRSGTQMSSLRNGLLSDYDAGGRALVARHAAEAGEFVAAEYNKAFVLMEYYGYLRRDVDQGGYAFWLDVLDRGGAGNYRGMVCAFVTSAEYQTRFSGIVSHGNGECGP